ncbi:MAG: AIR synthase-related protein, partial [candidate division NC10 bacterium]|nr:AIR synthase-related protein [candidate division NC10 bacterium]
FVAEDIGWYVIQINANDLATRGARPQWFLSTLLLPEGKASAEAVEGIFAQIWQACKSLGISWVGGHTEITYGLDRPIVVGCMAGEVAREKLVTTAGARVGDDILLTKGIAIEGTSIIARERADDLRKKGYDEEFLGRCKDFLYRPGISIAREAGMATEVTSIHSMHDPTEGGVANGLFELAWAAQVGISVDLPSVLIYPETRILCQEFSLDPLGLIASGALLLTLPPEGTATLLERFAREGIEACRIGRITAQEDGIRARDGGKERDLPYFERDEITKIFEN